MAQIIRVKPGLAIAQDGTYPELRGTRKSAAATQDVGGRYEEATFRGNVYAISNSAAGIALATTSLYSTTTATFTPILGLYNPLTNNKAFAILQAWCGETAEALVTGAQTGGFFWVALSGASITNGQTATPVNLYTLKAAGSSGVGIAGVALVGVLPTTTIPTLIRPVSAVSHLTPAAGSNVTAIVGTIAVEDVGGALIIPPGGFLGFANGISNAVATQLISAGMIYEEIPL
jgi:hypothetical protein